MKKYFSFSSTISGKSFFLRSLFLIIMCIPLIIALFTKWTYYFIGLGDFDISNTSFENQAQIQKFGDELGMKIAENPEFYLNDFMSSFTVLWIIIFLACIIPVIWFGLVNYYKRISALFYEQRNNIFFAVVTFDVISDIIILKYNTGSFILGIISILIYVYLIVENSEIDLHNG